MTSTKSTRKAYTVFDGDECTVIVFASTAGRAKSDAAGYLGTEYIYLNARRAKWLDRFPSADKIPAWFLIQGGWWFECYHCGMRLETETMYDAGLSTDDVVGNYQDAVFCCKACENLHDQHAYDKKGAIRLLKDYYQGKIEARFGEVEFGEYTHVYINRDMEVADVRIEVKMPFQTTRTCSFDSEWKSPITVEEALTRKLGLRIPHGDMDAARKYFYEREGITLD